MGIVIALANEKGGVGKTTSTVELATSLKLLKKDVLVVDFDHQGDTTRSVNGNPAAKNIFQVINVEVPIEGSIQHLEYFDLIAASKKLNTVEKTFTDRDDIYLLDEAFKPIKEVYDYILIDNNPDAGLLLSMSIVAADYVLIPTECDENAINGVKETEKAINKLKGGREKASHAVIMGYILTKYEEQTNMHSLAYEEILKIAAEKEDRPFVATISKAIRIAEAKTLRIPVSFEQKRSKQSQEYKKVAEEIIKRSEKGGTNGKQTRKD